MCVEIHNSRFEGNPLFYPMRRQEVDALALTKTISIISSIWGLIALGPPSLNAQLRLILATNRQRKQQEAV